jgi:hypothetical protein
MWQQAPEPFRLTRFRIVGSLVSAGLTALLAWGAKAMFDQPAGSSGTAVVAVTLIMATLISGFAAVAFLLPLQGPPTPTRFGRRSYVLIGDLVRDLATITGLEADHEPAWYPLLDQVRFGGDVAGRRASVTFFTETSGSASWTCVRLATAAEELPFLRVTQETVLTKISKAIGLTREVEIGDAEFDKRFLLETDRSKPASALLRGEVRGAIARIFDRGARDLTFQKGEIVVTARVETIELSSYRLIFDDLARIARTIDRKTLPVRVLGGDRRALIDDTGRTRCPYCRENVKGDEDDLVACEKCSTVLHDACWKEHGRCPLLGCSGRSPERARSH